MTIRDEDQLRAWSVDYAIRLYPKEEAVSPEQIISDARKLERYITGAHPAKVLRLVKGKDRPDSRRR